jgi:hypothetical protein
LTPKEPYRRLLEVDEEPHRTEEVIVTAKEELLETIRLWISAEKRVVSDHDRDYPAYANGARVTLLNLEELLDAL